MVTLTGVWQVDINRGGNIANIIMIRLRKLFILNAKLEWIIGHVTAVVF